MPLPHVERDEEPRTRRLARIGFAAGAVSLALLAASIRFAHHWNPVSTALVTAWAVATLTALVASVRGIVDATRSRRLAKWGIVLASVSVLALAVAGLAYAAGADPTGACGGG